MGTIQVRRRVLVNTDPERRCYDGHHFSSEWRWTPWEDIEEGVRDERMEDRLLFWRALTAYAVSERGQSAMSEYRAKKGDDL